MPKTLGGLETTLIFSLVLRNLGVSDKMYKCFDQSFNYRLNTCGAIFMTRGTFDSDHVGVQVDSTSPTVSTCLVVA